MPGRGVWMKKCRRIKGSWLLVVVFFAKSESAIQRSGRRCRDRHPRGKSRAPVSAGVGELLLGSAVDERWAEAARRFSGEVLSR
jgi:hypothetical protein